MEACGEHLDIMQLKHSAQPCTSPGGGCMGRLCPEMKGAVVIDDVVTAVRFLLSFFRPRSRSEVQWSQHGHGTVI